MPTMHMERRSERRRIGPGDLRGIENDSEQIVSPAAEEQGVLIGRWYYFLYTNGTRINLCRMQQIPGFPVLTEVMDPRHLAISDDDLECAVQFETCGFTEPGLYHISPLIEGKLRILFE